MEIMCVDERENFATTLTIRQANKQRETTNEK